MLLLDCIGSFIGFSNYTDAKILKTMREMECLDILLILEKQKRKYLLQTFV